MNRTEKKIDFAHLPNKVKSNWVASVLLLLVHVVYWMVNTRQLHFNGKLCTINQQFGYNAFATAKANNKWNFSIRWQTMSENGFGVCVCMVLASTLMKNTCDGIRCGRFSGYLSMLYSTFRCRHYKRNTFPMTLFMSSTARTSLVVADELWMGKPTSCRKTIDLCTEISFCWGLAIIIRSMLRKLQDEFRKIENDALGRGIGTFETELQCCFCKLKIGEAQKFEITLQIWETC